MAIFSKIGTSRLLSGGFLFDGIGALYPFEFTQDGDGEGVGRVEPISVVWSFGVDGIPETGVAGYGVCAVVFREGSGAEKKVFEVCGRRD
jgi:hypothetical protein